MRLAHMNNAKSREHAHTCRKARAIFKLRYKNKTNALSGTIQLADLPGKTEGVYLSVNQLTGSLELDGLPATVRELDLSENEFIEEIFLGNLPKGLKSLALSDNRLSAKLLRPFGRFPRKISSMNSFSLRSSSRTVAGSPSSSRLAIDS